MAIVATMLGLAALIVAARAYKVVLQISDTAMENATAEAAAARRNKFDTL